MKGSRMSLPTQMAIGMVLGIAAGALTPAMGLDPSWYKPVGQLFINLVRMVVVPLVLTTLVAGAASVGDVSKLGRVAGKTLAYYLVTTAVAVVIGLVLANIFQPGSGLSISTEGLKAKDVAPPTLVDVFLKDVYKRQVVAAAYVQGNAGMLVLKFRQQRQQPATRDGRGAGDDEIPLQLRLLNISDGFVDLLEAGVQRAVQRLSLIHISRRSGVACSPSVIESPQ